MIYDLSDLSDRALREVVLGPDEESDVGKGNKIRARRCDLRQLDVEALQVERDVLGDGCVPVVEDAVHGVAFLEGGTGPR